MGPGPLCGALRAGCAVAALAAAAPAVGGAESSPPAPGEVRVASLPALWGPADFAPRVSGRVPVDSGESLRRGCELALRRVEELPACRGLFEALGGDAMATLRGSIYYQPPAEVVRAGTCRGRNALTRIGSPATVLCPGFARLDPRRAAAALLHEALHHAGLEECPPTPGALTSAEITRMVLERCDL